jgi:nicotinate phosphoribosyltransferase
VILRPATFDARTDAAHSLLLTDLYQLTMLQAYWQHGMHEPAVFELFVRALPPGRRFLVAAGLESVLDLARDARFMPDELAWIDGCGRFASGFARWLEGLRFEGDLNALPEGTVFFPNEPMLQVIAPIAQAQLLETRILNLMHFQTVVASKAARAVLAAEGRSLIDFGLRRAHGAEAGLLAARSAWLAGFDGTATALAGPRYGIPVFGTMAHSFVQAHADETDAFERFAESFPANAMLLIDTYDTVAAARKVTALAPRLAARGIRIKGVRLDSGDLDALSREVRSVLDEAGLHEAIIFASGNLDEYRVRDLVRAGAPIDSFGVGTALTTSSDAPYLDAVYKLQEYAGQPRRKRSTGKATWPGRKQVWRRRDADGRLAHDVVGLTGDDGNEPPGTPLLVEAMRGGQRVFEDTLADARHRCADELDRLPAVLTSIEVDPTVACPVEISARVRALAAELDRASASPASGSGD